YLSLAETYVEKYTSRWDAMGYTAESLEAIADYAFAVRKRSFEEMDEIIGDWYKNGIVSTESIADHLRNLNEEESFLTTLLKTCALSRRPIDSDRMTVAVWREWGFSDEMILAAARESVGKANPIPYTGAILSSWKTKKIFSPQEIPNASPAKSNAAPPSLAQRTTKEEMDALLAEVAKRYQS
ncbi:MAG: DnaD domain protein, partial [Christensenellaceae bacterium]